MGQPSSAAFWASSPGWCMPVRFDVCGNSASAQIGGAVAATSSLIARSGRWSFFGSGPRESTLTSCRHGKERSPQLRARGARIGRSADRGGSSFTGYASAMAATYHGLAEAYGVDVIIDNSKLPADGAFLAHVPGVAASYVHVVRDARGVLASQMRRRSPSSRARRSVDATMLAASWVMRHTRSEQFDPERLLRVRYEDFVADPGATVARACRLLELPAVPFGAGPYMLPAVHTPRGPNPALTSTLVEDMSWKNELSRFERGLIGTLTAPWLVRDGYLKRNR